MRRLAVLTSGGDAPGMNAAIRSVVRNAVSRGFEVVGVHGGYRGLAEGDFRPMGRRDVGGIIHLGGTVLGTTRYEDLKTAEGGARGHRRKRLSIRGRRALRRRRAGHRYRLDHRQ